jgi:hypothetical protein
MHNEPNCCGPVTPGCDSPIGELPRYYPRQLITPDDLTLEQNYFRDRLRRHNRLVHGWGVVCGALVCPAWTKYPDGTTSLTPWQVKVRSGYVLGPYGDEIVIDCERTIDLRTKGTSGVTGEVCVDAPDPWCTPVYMPPAPSTTLFIAVKYKQSAARPVRVQPKGCGCDDSTCEYSRWKDGYEIGVLTTCPTCNACDPNTAKSPDFTQLMTGDLPTCPDCSCGPWVCLAQVTLNEDGSGTIAQIDNCSCRRLVVSTASMWWKCTSKLTIARVVPTTTGTGQPVLTINGPRVLVTVVGTQLYTNGAYDFGPGVAVTVKTAQSSAPHTSIDLELQATGHPGPHTLVVTNPDCSTAILQNAIAVHP